jgi:hypothetical protein
MATVQAPSTRPAPSTPPPLDHLAWAGEGRSTVSAGRAIAVVLGALGIASLLGADSLVRVAERQPYGTGRDLALAVTHPVQDVSHALGLHLPRLWLAELTGNEGPPATAGGFALEVPSVTTAPPATRPPVTNPSDDAALPPPLTTAPTTTVATTTTLAPRRVPTAQHPLRVWMGGDSLIGNISSGFGRFTREDPRVAITADAQVSTGLVRTDVLDWPTYLQQQLAAHNPEVVYLFFGANDDQPLRDPAGHYLRLGASEWQAEYGRRVGIMMDIAAQGDRTVVWIGMPVVEPDRLDAARVAMNRAAVEQADLRPRVAFVDTVPLFAGPDGGFSDTVTTPSGATIDARLEDGVHLTHAACDVLAAVLHSVIATEWHLT